MDKPIEKVEQLSDEEMKLLYPMLMKYYNDLEKESSFASEKKFAEYLERFCVISNGLLNLDEKYDVGNRSKLFAKNQFCKMVLGKMKDPRNNKKLENKIEVID